MIEGELHFIRECSFPCVCAHARARPPKRLGAVQLEALTADGQRLTAWPSSSSTREAKRLTHGRLRGAYLQLPAPEATALVLVEGPADALAARWLHPGTVVWCCGGALRSPFTLTRRRSQRRNSKSRVVGALRGGSQSGSPLNSPSKMVTPELEFPLRAGLKYAEVPGTPDVIRYVEGS